MKEGPDISKIAALIGDPARANMLAALMSGMSLTATELAAEAGITPQTASSHLGKMTQSNLLIQRKQGRHRYYALANEQVALVLGGLLGLAENAGHTRVRPGPRNNALRKARSCYNHLAGDMGISLFDRLSAKGYIAGDGPTLTLSQDGRKFAETFGIDVTALEKKQTPVCRACLDWSARRSHLAGSLGRAFLARFEELGWAKRDAHSRAILFSREGEKLFGDMFE